MTATLAHDTEVRLGDLITVGDAVRKSGLSSTTLHYHIANGLIPVYRLGPLVVMRREDLDRFPARASHGPKGRTVTPMAKTRTIDRKLYAETRYADGSFEMVAKRGRRSATVTPPYSDGETRFRLGMTLGIEGQGGRDYWWVDKLPKDDALALARAWASQ